MTKMLNATTIPPDQSLMAPIQPQYNFQQQIPIAEPATPNKTNSSALICLGSLQLIASCVLFCICMWAISITDAITANYIVLVSCLYCGVISILTILSGRDVGSKRCFVGTSVGLAFAGIIIVFGYAISFSSISWLRSLAACECEESEWSTKNIDVGKCYFKNCDDIRSVHISFVACTSIQAIVNGLIASVGFIYLCRCCGNQQSQNVTPGQIIQLPPRIIEPIIYPPSQYHP